MIFSITYKFCRLFCLLWHLLYPKSLQNWLAKTREKLEFLPLLCFIPMAVMFCKKVSEPSSCSPGPIACFWLCLPRGLCRHWIMGDKLGTGQSVSPLFPTRCWDGIWLHMLQGGRRTKWFKMVLRQGLRILLRKKYFIFFSWPCFSLEGTAPLVVLWHLDAKFWWRIPSHFGG